MINLNKDNVSGEFMIEDVDRSTLPCIKLYDDDIITTYWCCNKIQFVEIYSAENNRLVLYERLKLDNGKYTDYIQCATPDWYIEFIKDNLKKK